MDITPDLFGNELSFTITQTNPNGTTVEIDHLNYGTIKRGQTSRHIYIYHNLAVDAVYELQVRDIIGGKYV